MNIPEASLAMRRANRARTVTAMRDGNVIRATYIPPRKGKGSYDRKLGKAIER